MTFYFEGQIVHEMKRRKGLTESNQLKVAYCEITYRMLTPDIKFLTQNAPAESVSTYKAIKKIGRHFGET